LAKVNKTIDKDLGHSEILTEVDNIKGAFVEIGVQDTGETYDDAITTVAEVAFFNEFGTSTIPERSFIRSTIDENRSELDQLTFRLLDQIIANKLDTKKALDKLGFKIQQLIRKKILDLNDPANAPSTIARKGFNNPLVDSRRLWRSIAFEANMNPKKKRKAG